MSSDCGDSCVFPVANLKSDSIQQCDQKCSYYGNYIKMSDNNTVVNEAPYTMGKIMYNGKSDVIFNGISYSNTSENNNIEIAITKPLHTFGEDGATGVGELIIQHQKNNTGVAPLWVCIPINNSSIISGSAGTRSTSTGVIEMIIDSLPGVPFITKGVKNNKGNIKKDKVLVRRGDNSSQGFTDYTYHTASSEYHRHSDEDGNVKHRHSHIPGLHVEDDSTAQDFMNAYTQGSTQISNQSTLGKSFKLNDVIPLAPYYFYKGVFNTTSEVTYTSCSNVDNIQMNVVVFDITNGIPISSIYASKLSAIYEAGNAKTSYPLLMDHNYIGIPDTFNNVSYHPQPFANEEEDEIYIDCRPIDSKTEEATTTVLEKTKKNDVLDSGASLSSIILSFVNSSFFAIIVGVIAMILLFKFCRFLLQLLFGKQQLPNPGEMMKDVVPDVTVAGKK